MREQIIVSDLATEGDYDVLRRLSTGKKCVFEFGSFIGGSALAMLPQIKEAGGKRELVDRRSDRYRLLDPHLADADALVDEGFGLGDDGGDRQQPVIGPILQAAIGILVGDERRVVERHDRISLAGSCSREKG